MRVAKESVIQARSRGGETYVQDNPWLGRGNTSFSEDP